MLTKLLQTGNDRAVTTARLLLGIVFFVQGAQLIFGTVSLKLLVRMMGVPSSLVLLAVLTEFLAGLGLIFGFFSRVAAVGIATDMIVAVLLWAINVRLFEDWSGIQGGGDLAYFLLALALALMLVAKGGGAFSLDRALWHRFRAYTGQYPAGGLR